MVIEQHTENITSLHYNIEIVPEKERLSFLSVAVTTRSQCNEASAEASGSNQGYNTLLSPLILRDICQEWDLYPHNIIQLARSTNLFTILKYRRRRQFLLQLFPLIAATSVKARERIPQHAKQNARQTQTSGIESCQCSR